MQTLNFLFIQTMQFGVMIFIQPFAYVMCLSFTNHFFWWRLCHKFFILLLLLLFFYPLDFSPLLLYKQFPFFHYLTCPLIDRSPGIFAVEKIRMPILYFMIMLIFDLIVNCFNLPFHQFVLFLKRLIILYSSFVAL